MPPAEAFQELRPLLFSIAYRMLGSAASAEDVLQEAFVRFDRALDEGAEVRSPKAYLSTVVTRLAIDELKSARARREAYVGAWLPEPILTDRGSTLVSMPSDPAANAEAAETLTMAFLLVLERLDPVERAVFLLHDVFGYEFGEISGIVGKSEANCRQIAVRARRRVRDAKPKLDPPDADHRRLAESFFAAMTAGDVGGLADLLAEGAVVIGDGGGKAPQWAGPIIGKDRIMRLLAGVGGQIAAFDISLEPREINGQPGAILRNRAGQVTNVFVLEFRHGRVAAVRSVINPDKLGHLGPVADVRALAREARGLAN
jgi:RNA polymerase sigma-70 factor (ECF subfamily)